MESNKQKTKKKTQKYREWKIESKINEQTKNVNH